MEKQPWPESNFGLLLCPKSIENGQIITDLAKTVLFGKYYFNKLQLNFKRNYDNFFSNFSKFCEPLFLKNFVKIKFRKRRHILCVPMMPQQLAAGPA
jgi:hypothetical protein